MDSQCPDMQTTPRNPGNKMKYRKYFSLSIICVIIMALFPFIAIAINSNYKLTLDDQETILILYSITYLIAATGLGFSFYKILN